MGAWVVLTSYGQKKMDDYLLAFSDTLSGAERWGFKTPKGQVIIQPKYEYVLTDTMVTIAFVFTHSKWVAINRQDSIILALYLFDNGPDYVREGLFRYVENGKVGFANLRGQKVIKARFDFVSTFSSGLAAFNAGGQSKKIDEEHTSWRGGLWGFINKKGQVVIEPAFTQVYDFKGKYCEAWTRNNKHVLIDKKGNPVKQLSK
jgi:hypothetical protein